MKTYFFENFHFWAVWAQITINGHLGPKIRFASYLDKNYQLIVIDCSFKA